MRGIAIPVAPNKEPAIEIDEITTGAVPDEVKATVPVAVVPTATLPNDTDGALRVSAAVPFTGDNAITNVDRMPPACAVMVAICATVTAATVALNPVEAAPDRTVTPPGTLTAGLLLVRATCTLLLVVDVRYTEHASVPDALNAFRPHEIRLSVGVADAVNAVVSSPMSHRSLPSFLSWTL